MSQENPLRIFVTHCFSENDDYLRVFEFLESSPNFFYKNFSNPEAMPTGGGAEAIKEELRKQIQLAEVVIVLTSVYDQHRDLLMFMLNAAQANDKPLVAMEIYGQVTEVPEEIRSRCNAVAPWNERMMIDVLLREARHEATNRWETIEFEL
ncbi:MAG: hypothetical protein PVF63_05385 [Gammaproteobacteria bacterium]|jgi:hypothetical protein